MLGIRISHYSNIIIYVLISPPKIYDPSLLCKSSMGKSGRSFSQIFANTPDSFSSSCHATELPLHFLLSLKTLPFFFLLSLSPQEKRHGGFNPSNTIRNDRTRTCNQQFPKLEIHILKKHAENNTYIDSESFDSKNATQKYHFFLCLGGVLHLSQMP